MWCPEGDLNPHAKGGGHPQNSNVFHRFFVLLMALLCHLLCQQAPDRAERARDYMPWHKKTSPAHMEGMTANNTITTMSDALATDRPTLGSAARIGDRSGHAAWVASVVMMVSYSMGVNRPRASCRLRRW